MIINMSSLQELSSVASTVESTKFNLFDEMLVAKKQVWEHLLPMLHQQEDYFIGSLVDNDIQKFHDEIILKFHKFCPSAAAKVYSPFCATETFCAKGFVGAKDHNSDVTQSNQKTKDVINIFLHDLRETVCMFRNMFKQQRLKLQEAKKGHRERFELLSTIARNEETLEVIKKYDSALAQRILALCPENAWSLQHKFLKRKNKKWGFLKEEEPKEEEPKEANEEEKKPKEEEPKEAKEEEKKPKEEEPKEEEEEEPEKKKRKT